MNKLNEMPILPLRAVVIFPNTSTSIDVNRAASIAAVTYAVNNKSRIVAVKQKNSDDEIATQDNLCEVGTLCDISKVVKVDDNLIKVYLDGINLVNIGDYKSSTKILKADVYEHGDRPQIDNEELIAFKSYIVKTAKALERECHQMFPNYIKKGISECENAEMLTNLSSGLLNSNVDKYELLITESPKARLEILCELLALELARGKKISEIERQVQDKIAKNNNEYILREQLKIITDELDGGDAGAIDELKEKIVQMEADEEIKEKLNKEVDRLARLSESSPEASILRSYLDVVLSLPWGKLTADESDLKKVREVLDEDHYGIDEVKDRIVEYLAVRQLAESKAKGTVICLSGPPGVGKTSIAKSIARALGKEYVQLTLGGLHDEAEIRGHRKTYIGAMPGRIITSLARAKTNNPVFLLDEVDKLTKDMRGDPQSALLEVLDPNQNKLFRDNYIELPYDLSNVMFILTANDIGALDKPLLDRLEVINMDGYTTDEKTAIAEKYLIKKQSIENGIGDGRMNLSKTIIRDIIEGYTSESGVRELERKIATIARKIAYKIVALNEDMPKFTLKSGELKSYLGARKNSDIQQVTKGEVGRVIGLAWTSVGGVTLEVESMILEGSGKLKLTGSLGDVMKESAQIAVSLAQKMTLSKGITKKFIDEHDIHVHVPMGAVPKDGPSAGVTLTTAIYSALTGAKVCDSVAMTGEVSLSGRVLPIGGLKEKALAAHRIGIKTIIIPVDNQQDLDKLPKVVLSDIDFVKVSNIEQVLARAIVGYSVSECGGAL